MKTDRKNAGKPVQQPAGNNPRPENKDNLDSRENLETNNHGGHNKKQVHQGEKNEHNDPMGREQKK